MWGRGGVGIGEGVGEWWTGDRGRSGEGLSGDSGRLGVE